MKLKFLILIFLLASLVSVSAEAVTYSFDTEGYFTLKSSDNSPNVIAVYEPNCGFNGENEGWNYPYDVCTNDDKGASMKELYGNHYASIGVKPVSSSGGKALSVLNNCVVSDIGVRSEINYVGHRGIAKTAILGIFNSATLGENVTLGTFYHNTNPILFDTSGSPRIQTGERSVTVPGNYNLNDLNPVVRVDATEFYVDYIQMLVTIETSDEICDGIDNDCDGQIDEGCFGDPIVTLISPLDGGVYNTPLIEVDSTANQNIDTWTYSLNGTPETGFTPGSTILNLPEGCYDIIVFGENSNGIGEDSASFCIDLTGDITIPLINIVSPENKTYTTNEILINVTSNQNIDNWEMSINGGAFEVLNNPETQLFSEGCWSLNVSGTNANGIGYDSSSFCVVLSTDPDEPSKKCSKNSCNQEDDMEENLFDSGVENFILYRDRESLIFGGEEDGTAGISFYPIMIGLLLLGIIIMIILSILLVSKKTNGTESLY